MLVGYKFIEATFKSASNINFSTQKYAKILPYFTHVYTEIKWLLCVRFCTVLHRLCVIGSSISGLWKHCVLVCICVGTGDRNTIKVTLSDNDSTIFSG